MGRDLSVEELQADEIRTIIGSREQAIWVFVVIDVRSRFCPSTVVGKRIYRNTLDLFQDLSNRRNLEVPPLLTTDGFKFYERVIGRVFGTCVYGDHESVIEFLLELEKLTVGSPGIGYVQPLSQIFMITASAS